MEKTYSQTIRETVKTMSGLFSPADVEKAMPPDTRTHGKKEKKYIHSVLTSFVQAGELRKVSYGRYEFSDKKDVSLKAVMWRILRARRNVTLEDLTELSGAARGYAEQWINSLSRQGIVRTANPGGHRGKIYQMIADPGPEVPEDERMKKRLRAIREAKKNEILELKRKVIFLLNQIDTLVQEDDDV